MGKCKYKTDPKKDTSGEDKKFVSDA